MRNATRLFLVLTALASAAHAQYWGGGGGTAGERATFILCNGSPCTTGVDLTNKWIAIGPGKVKKCYAVAKTAPQGGPITIDIRNGTTSIFGAQPKLTIPAGSNAVATVAAFDAASIVEGNLLRVDLVTVGNTYAGAGVTVVCKIQ